MPSFNRPSDRLFYLGSSLAIVVVVFVGFAPTYYLRERFHPEPLSILVQLHGFVFTSWILLFLIQTSLIAGRLTYLHRRLGLGGAVLAGVVVVLGFTTAIVSARRNYAAGHAEALTFLAIPFGDLLTFSVLAAAGIWYRRRSDVHKRLMFLATICLLDAAFARWPLAIVADGPRAFFGATDLFIVAAVVHDLVSQRRLHPATIWGGVLIVVSQPLRLVIARTDPWLAVARALAG